MVYVLQVAAILMAILLIPLPDFFLNIPSILTTLVRALFAWMQLKRYQELSQSYGVAAQELSEIYESYRSVQSEDELSTHILDAEQAISREHTLWIARKTDM